MQCELLCNYSLLLGLGMHSADHMVLHKVNEKGLCSYWELRFLSADFANLSMCCEVSISVSGSGCGVKLWVEMGKNVTDLRRMQSL